MREENGGLGRRPVIGSQTSPLGGIARSHNKLDYIQLLAYLKKPHHRIPWNFLYRMVQGVDTRRIDWVILTCFVLPARSWGEYPCQVVTFMGRAKVEPRPLRARIRPTLNASHGHAPMARIKAPIECAKMLGLFFSKILHLSRHKVPLDPSRFSTITTSEIPPVQKLVSGLDGDFPTSQKVLFAKAN